MKHWRVIFVILLIAIGLVVMVCGCSPQKRLNRLVKNHPELLKIDTVYSTKTVTLAAESKDTSIAASQKVEGLYQLIFGLTGKLDSLERRELVKQITNYITNRPCLDGEVIIPFGSGGTVKLWQQGGVFFAQVRRPAQEFKLSFPQIISTYQIHRHYKWSLFAFGVIIGWLSLLCIILIYPKKNKA